MSPGIDRIPSGLIQEINHIFTWKIQKSIKSIRNKEGIPQQWKKSTLCLLWK